MSKLPKGWALAQLSDIVEPFQTIDPGKTPEKTFQYVEIGSIDNTNFKIVEPATITGANAPSRARRVIKTGDILFSTVRTYLKNIAIVPEELDGQLTSTGIAVIRPNQAIDGGLLFRYVISEKFLTTISGQQDGTLYPAITDKDLFASVIPLAPLAEQKRIVAKVDSLSAKSAHARDELTRVEKLVPRLKQGILKEILSLSTSSDGTYVSLSDVADTAFDGPFGSNLKSEDYTDAGKYVVRLENIGHLYYKTGKDTFISEEKFDALSRHKLLENDVLFSSFIEEQVRVCLLPADLDSVAINKADVFCVRPNAKLCLSKFLMYVLGQPGCYEQLKELVHGATRPRINLRQLKSYKFHLPDLNMQQAIVSRIDLAFAKIDIITAEARRALTLVDRLDEAVLAKAFRGELVPQDPNDEPANALLERIAAERAAEAKKPKSSHGQPRGTIAGSHIGPSRAKAIRRSLSSKGSEMTKSRKDDDVMGKPYLAGKIKSFHVKTVQGLFGSADLPVADFYKQLAWEIENGFITDDSDQLRAV